MKKRKRCSTAGQLDNQLYDSNKILRNYNRPKNCCNTFQKDFPIDSKAFIRYHSVSLHWLCGDQNWTDDDFWTMLFSDEIRFNLSSNFRRNQYGVRLAVLTVTKLICKKIDMRFPVSWCGQTSGWMVAWIFLCLTNWSWPVNSILETFSSRMLDFIQVPIGKKFHYMDNIVTCTTPRLYKIVVTQKTLIKSPWKHALLIQIHWKFIGCLGDFYFCSTIYSHK